MLAPGNPANNHFGSDPSPAIYAHGQRCSPETQETPVIFLIDNMEQAPDYPNYTVEAIKAMRFEHFPITIGDFSAPGVEDFELVLTTVDWAVDRGKIFVHCQDGFRGTAIIGTAYWVYRGFSVKEAIEKIRQSNPQAIERVEPEKSLYGLKAVIESGNTWGKTPSSWLK